MGQITAVLNCHNFSNQRRMMLIYTREDSNSDLLFSSFQYVIRRVMVANDNTSCMVFLLYLSYQYCVLHLSYFSLFSSCFCFSSSFFFVFSLDILLLFEMAKKQVPILFFLQKKTDLFESLLAACFPLTGHHASTSLCALWQLHCSRCWLLLWCACIMKKKKLEFRILSLLGAWKMKM